MNQNKLPSRALSVRYTVNVDKISSIADEIENEFMKAVTEEINHDIIERICISHGWYKRSYRGDQHISVIKEWCSLHCQDSYRVFYDRAVFKSHHDAVLFQLTWS